MNGGGTTGMCFPDFSPRNIPAQVHLHRRIKDQGPLYAVRRVPSARNLCAFDMGILDGKGIVDLYLGPEQIALLENVKGPTRADATRRRLG